MKYFVLFLLLTSSLQTVAQKKADNIIILTTDGFRWQEMFGGVDTSLANNPRFNEDGKAFIQERFGDANPLESRKKLLPFIWSTLLKKDRYTGIGNSVIM